MRMSISTTCGNMRRARSMASRPVAASADDLHLVLGVDQRRECAAHGGLVVSDEHADHERAYGSPASTRKPARRALGR